MSGTNPKAGRQRCRTRAAASCLRFKPAASTSSPRRDGSFGELFLENHKVDLTAGIMASDAAIAASLALQFSRPAETLRKALCRDAYGNATGPLGIALDLLAEEKRSDDA